MLAIAIKDVKVCLGNLNLLLEKTQFDLSFWLKMKRLVSKRLVHYTTYTKNLFHRGICIFWENLDQNPPFASKSNYYNP